MKEQKQRGVKPPHTFYASELDEHAETLLKAPSDPK